jgi:hypothetical protein
MIRIRGGFDKGGNTCLINLQIEKVVHKGLPASKRFVKCL